MLLNCSIHQETWHKWVIQDYEQTQNTCRLKQGVLFVDNTFFHYFQVIILSIIDMMILDYCHMHKNDLIFPQISYIFKKFR